MNRQNFLGLVVLPQFPGHGNLNELTGAGVKLPSFCVVVIEDNDGGPTLCRSFGGFGQILLIFCGKSTGGIGDFGIKVGAIGNGKISMPEISHRDPKIGLLNDSMGKAFAKGADFGFGKERGFPIPISGIEAAFFVVPDHTAIAAAVQEQKPRGSAFACIEQRTLLVIKLLGVICRIEQGSRIGNQFFRFILDCAQQGNQVAVDVGHQNRGKTIREHERNRTRSREHIDQAFCVVWNVRYDRVFDPVFDSRPNQRGWRKGANLLGRAVGLNGRDLLR